MRLPTPTSWKAVLCLLAVFALAGACANPIPTTSGVASTTPIPAASQAASSPSPAATAASPSPSAGGGLVPTVATACLTLGPLDCERARTFAGSTLTPLDPPVRYVQVGPFGCAAGDRCPTTLLARPEGDVVIEFADDTAVNIHLKVGADGTFAVDRQPGMGIAVPPSSAPGMPAGPIEFSLGHCGIFSGIDLDGDRWDPVGPVQMDSGEAVNATPGVITISDPTHATFTTRTGFAIQLLRREGSKFLPFCM
jgi:hypothetical protein